MTLKQLTLLKDMLFLLPSCVPFPIPLASQPLSETQTQIYVVDAEYVEAPNLTASGIKWFRRRDLVTHRSVQDCRLMRVHPFWCNKQNCEATRVRDEVHAVIYTYPQHNGDKIVSCGRNLKLGPGSGLHPQL